MDPCSEQCHRVKPRQPIGRSTSGALVRRRDHDVLRDGRVAATAFSPVRRRARVASSQIRGPRPRTQVSRCPFVALVVNRGGARFSHPIMWRRTTMRKIAALLFLSSLSCLLIVPDASASCETPTFVGHARGSYFLCADSTPVAALAYQLSDPL